MFTPAELTELHRCLIAASIIRMVAKVGEALQVPDPLSAGAPVTFAVTDTYRVILGGKTSAELHGMLVPPMSLRVFKGEDAIVSIADGNIEFLSRVDVLLGFTRVCDFITRTPAVQS